MRDGPAIERCGERHGQPYPIMARMIERPRRRWLALLGLVAAGTIAAPAGAQGPETLVLSGVVSTTGGAVNIPGVSVELEDRLGNTVATVRSDPTGAYRIDDVPPGSYRLVVAYAGLVARVLEIRLEPGVARTENVELQIMQFEGAVDAVTPLLDVARSEAAAPGSLDADRIERTPGRSSSIESALTTPPGVVGMPQGTSIRGAYPHQTGVQIGAANVNDPVTNRPLFLAPSGSVAVVEVLPNPAAAELGRFSSGVSVLTPKSGGERWQVDTDRLFPRFHLQRDTLFGLAGIRRFTPRLTAGGPLLGGRVRLVQTLSYQYRSPEIFSRPLAERPRSWNLQSLTRADARLRDGHTLTVLAAVMPERRQFDDLDTFTDPEATLDRHHDSRLVSVASVWALSSSVLLDSAFSIGRYNTRIEAQGAGSMRLDPDRTGGNYYNQQRSDARTVQLVEAVTFVSRGPTGAHVTKLGVDLRTASADLRSASQPVEVYRTDGSLVSRRLFGPPSRQSVGATDVSVFAQDSWSPGARLQIDTGLRMDRDGLTGGVDVGPRLSVAIGFGADGVSTLTGGVGLFHERTPLAVGAFERLEQPVVQQFEADGATPIGPPVAVSYRSSPTLRAPRSVVWHLHYTHRLTRAVSVRAGGLARSTTRELTLLPSPLGELRLESLGRSSYRDLEIGARVAMSSGARLDVAYVWSHARTDLNRFASFFGSRREPILQVSAHGPADADTPHSLVVSGDTALGSNWRVKGFVEWRSGRPYTAIDERLAAVGPRNGFRFPHVGLVDLAVDRRFRALGLTAWIGLGLDNALGRLHPRDVQRNMTSTQFGQFFDSEPRRLTFNLRIEG